MMSWSPHAAQRTSSLLAGARRVSAISCRLTGAAGNGQDDGCALLYKAGIMSEVLEEANAP